MLQEYNLGPNLFTFIRIAAKNVTCSKFKIKTLNQSVAYVFHANNIVFNRRPGSIYLIFIISFEHISHLVLVFCSAIVDFKHTIAGWTSFLSFTLRDSPNPLTTNVPYHVDTSQLICNANHLTGFYVDAAKIVKGFYLFTTFTNKLHHIYVTRS